MKYGIVGEQGGKISGGLGQELAVLPLIPQDLVRRQGPAEFGFEIDSLGAAARPPRPDVRAKLTVPVRDLASDLLERERP